MTSKERANSEARRLIGWLEALIGERHSPVYLLTHPHDPQPKQRARRSSGTGSWYTPRRTVTASRALALDMRAIRSPRMDGNVALAWIAYCGNRRRRDRDNIDKLICDAGNDAGIWHDDDQVTAGAQIMRLDRDNPRLVIAWCEYVSSLDKRRTSK